MRGLLVLAAAGLVCGCSESGIEGRADTGLDHPLDRNDPLDGMTDALDATADVAPDSGRDPGDATPGDGPDGDADEPCIPANCPCEFDDECCCLSCHLVVETGKMLCCAELPFCVPNGGCCVSDEDCCSGTCDPEGHCV